MMHIVKLIRRRHPHHADAIIKTGTLLSLAVLGIGIGLAILF